MKVLHLEAGRNLYGGARQVQYLVQGLAARGVDNLLVVPRASALAAALVGGETAIHEIEMQGDLDLGLVFRLKRLLQRERPDIVHVHSRRGADLFGGFAARWCDVPAVLSRRVDNPEPRFVARLKYALYARVITISEEILRVLLAAGVEREKLACVRSAVDPSPYTQGCDREWLLREFDLPPEARVLGVVAQLIARKGHRYLLAAMPQLLHAFPEVRLLLFGQGPEEARIRALIRGLGLQREVRLAGFRDDLPSILPCLELLVHPALKEGLGVALLQAASAGVPIVACDAGGVPEVVRDGHNGLLVTAGDSAALGDAVTQLLRDSERARTMGLAGRRLMQDEFSVDAMVEGNLQIYRRLLGG